MYRIVVMSNESPVIAYFIHRMARNMEVDSSDQIAEVHADVLSIGYTQIGQNTGPC